MQSNSYSDAIERYTCAMALRENDAIYYSNRAAAYTQMPKYNEVIKDCLKSIEIDPSYSKAYSRMGLAYHAQGKYSDAINKGFNKALELDPNNDAVRENIRHRFQLRAAAYTQMPKYNEAIKDCLKSIEIDPSYSKAYSRMGLAYHAQGKYSDAINKGFNKALELDPNNDAVRENIRVAEQKLIEEREQRNRYQNSGFHFGGGTGNAGAASSFGSFPANIASMFSNLGGNAAQNQSGQSGSAEDSNNGTGARYVDMNSIPADIVSLVENMTRTFSEQGSESMPFKTVQPSSTSVNFESGEGIGRGIARFSYDIDIGGHIVEELNRAFSSMMGSFNPQPPPPQEGRPDSR